MSDKTEQLKFRLSGQLRLRLQRAADSNGWPLSEEVRRRLELSFRVREDVGDSTAPVRWPAKMKAWCLGKGQRKR